MLLPKSIDSTAAIGSDASHAVASGRDSGSLNVEYKIKPLQLDTRRTSAGERCAQVYNPRKGVPLAPDYCTTPYGEPGVLLEYFEGPNLKGQAVRRIQQTTTSLYLLHSPPEALRNTLHSFRVSTIIAPETTGNHTFGFSSVGPGRLLLNGQVFIDNWDWTEAGDAMLGSSKEVVKSVLLLKGKPIEVVVESTNEIRPHPAIPIDAPSHQHSGCRIGFREEQATSPFGEAVGAARCSNIAIVVLGLAAEWELERCYCHGMNIPKDGS